MNMPPQSRSRRMKPYRADIELENCHAVRQLRVCAGCAAIGDGRHMIRQERGKACRHFHGRCFIKSHGMTLFLQLPRAETDKLALDDIGSDAMKALMNRSAK